MKKNYLVLSLILFFTFFTVESAMAQIPILVKGKVMDELLGNPVENVTLTIKPKQGRKMKIKTNQEGKFEQILMSGQDFEVIMTANHIVRAIKSFSTDQSDEYIEQDLTLTVKRLTPGHAFYQVDGYKENASDLGNGLKDLMDELQEIMKFNRSVKFKIIVSAHDTYTKKAPVVEKPKKKKKSRRKSKKKEEPKKVEQVSPELVKELVDSRLASLQAYIDTFKRIKKRIIIEADYSLAEIPAPDQSKSTNPDIIIMVEDVTSVFGK